jgi:UDP-3-O-[3-hydroxymyristoyl] glucosamine N-acyltransferase
MKFHQPFSLQALAVQFQCTFAGNPQLSVQGINEIHRVVEGDIVFVDHPKYYDKALQSKASVVLIDKEVACPEGKGLIVHENPFQLFNAIAAHFYDHRIQVPTQEAYANLFPGVYFGNNVRIGEQVRIFPGACILDDTVIGDRVVIGSNTVIGHHAFYYKKVNGAYFPMFNCGSVLIEDDVEIGASCTIDRGVTDVTILGRGTKIDNQVQIGHDTRIGANCLLAAQVGVAGCVDMEDKVTLWGQVGCASGIRIGEGAIVLAQSGISKDLKGNTTYFGSPCGEVREKFKEIAAIKQLSVQIKGEK